MEAFEPPGGNNLNLYWKSVPVLLRRGERGEERAAELTVRLIASGHKAGQRVRRGWVAVGPMACKAPSWWTF